MLKVSAFLDNTCAQYTDAEQAKDRGQAALPRVLGPNQPGIDQPDPIGDADHEAPRASAERERREGPPAAATEDAPSSRDAGRAAAPAARRRPRPQLPDAARRCRPSVQELLDDVLGRPGAAPASTRAPTRSSTSCCGS